MKTQVSCQTVVVKGECGKGTQCKYPYRANDEKTGLKIAEFDREHLSRSEAAHLLYLNECEGRVRHLER